MTVKTYHVDGQRLEDDHDNRAHLRLWAAVFHRGLVDAAFDLHSHLNPKPDKKTGKIVHRPMDAFEGLQWIWSDRDTGAGSFLWLCGLFDLDPARARDAWRRNARALQAKHSEVF